MKKLRLRLNGVLYQVQVKPLFDIFHWTFALLKASRVNEEIYGKGISQTSGTQDRRSGEGS
jgi:hypothetical protein